MRCIAYPLILAASLAAAGPALAQPFSGLRVEGILGYDYDHNIRHSDGLLYGGGVGYDVQLGRLVAGVDGEVAGATNRNCYQVIAAPARSGCSTAERDLSVGGRVGALLTPRILLYATAGYTNYVKQLSTFSDGDLLDRVHNHFDGARVGAGLEYAIAPHMYVKTEYRYSNYDRGLDRHQVVGGVGVRF